MSQVEHPSLSGAEIQWDSRSPHAAIVRDGSTVAGGLPAGLKCLVSVVLLVLLGGCGPFGPKGRIQIDSPTSLPERQAWETFCVPAGESETLDVIAREIRRCLTDRGLNVVDETESAPDVYVSYGYEYQDFREVSTTSGSTYQWKDVQWSTPAQTRVSYNTRVTLNLGFVTPEALQEVEFDFVKAPKAWEGRIMSVLSGSGEGAIPQHAPLLVENILAEFPERSGLELFRRLEEIWETPEEAESSPTGDSDPGTTVESPADVAAGT